MIAIIDCGAAETAALKKSLASLDADGVSVTSADELHRASSILLPHAKSYRRVLGAMRDCNLVAPLLTAIDAGCPVLAIGSGMHLLFDAIRDSDQHAGLGVFPGTVGPFDFGNHAAARHFTSPHQGWNQVFWNEACPLLKGLSSGEFFFFDHAGHAVARDTTVVAATCNHGLEFPAVVGRGDLFGAQFLPERSEAAGKTVLMNFLKLAA
ncbi:MAG TPA: imidazole glycerol phosphate synthase subunit HisH [Phycisphaerae bacterium]|nr:imidazole glycerol phosphate synthase subunit HisH [Phycisphaerae bacterium]